MFVLRLESQRCDIAGFSTFTGVEFLANLSISPYIKIKKRSKVLFKSFTFLISKNTYLKKKN